MQWIEISGTFGHYLSLLISVVTRRRPSVVKPKPPSNKFLEALDQIERAMYTAQAAGLTRHSTHRLAKIRANIKLATQQRNYLFARQSLGHALYSAIQLARKGRKKRSTTSASSAVKTFMDSVKRDLGSTTFETFMSVKGDVTLMFAIDDTGSMGDEIQAAKDIAKSIVNHPRKEKVDYILSPFNDPSKYLQTKLSCIKKQIKQTKNKKKSNETETISYRDPRRHS